MALHAQYRRDKVTAWLAVTAGVEIECSLFDPRQPEYINVMTKLTKPVRKLIEQNLLKPSEDRKYAIRAFVEAVVKGWRTIVSTDADGKPVYRDEIEVKEGEWLPFTFDNAVDLFTRYPQFYTDTVELARELSSFQVSEEERKNSQTV